MTGELLGVDASKGAEHVGLRRREPRQLEREGQHDLPKRHGGQDAVNPVRRLRRHPTPRTAWAQAAIFTRESHKQVVLAAPSAQVNEAARAVAAAQIPAKQ